jgi:16S rRNA processing protein RimM
VGPWGIKGWLKVQAHSPDPAALLSAKDWFLQAPPAQFGPGFRAFTGTVSLAVEEVKIHSTLLVVKFALVSERNGAEALRGASIFLPRSSFPPPAADEYYWADLIGLTVLNRQGLALGVVRDLMSTGPHAVLCIEPPPEVSNDPEQDKSGKAAAECLIPFVSAYVDTVDMAARRITVDWQPDY